MKGLIAVLLASAVVVAVAAVAVSAETQVNEKAITKLDSRTQTLYSMKTPCDLMAIDSETGSPITIGSIGYAAEDFSFSPEGILYASADKHCGVHGGANTLIKIDLETGEGTEIGSIGFGDVDAMAFAPDGTLYAVDASTDQLIKIDSLTGEGTAVGPVGFPFIGGMDFSLDGTLFATDISGGGGGPSTLLTIDTTTGEGTAIGAVGFNTVEGIAFTPDGTLFGVSDFLGGGTGELIVIDTETGTGTAVGPVITSGNMDGLAAVHFAQAPTVSITTDEFEYSPGDTMNVEIEVANPREDRLALQWWWLVPEYSVCVGLTAMPLSVPARYEETLEYSFAVPDLGAKWFSNAFLVQLAETKAGGGEGAGGGAVLDADAACWIYRPAGREAGAAQTAVGEAEVEIADEIKEAIEKWSRASEKRLSSFFS